MQEYDDEKENDTEEDIESDLLEYYYNPDGIEEGE